MAAKRRNSKKPNDDLTVIEGIGPKIAKLLTKANIDSYARLARTSTRKLEAILEEAGGAYKSHDPSTWGQQAKLARDGKWKPLKTLQDKLQSGRKPKRGKRPTKSSKRTTVKPDPPTATVVFSSIDGGQYQPGHPFVIQRILSDEEAEAEYQFRKSELDKEWEAAEAASDKLWERLKELDQCRDHITGMSVKYRTKYRRPVSPLKVVVAVDVARKISPEDRAEMKRCRKHKGCNKFVDLRKLGEEFGVEVKVLEGAFQYLTNDRAIPLTGAKPNEPIGFDEELTGGIPIAPASAHQLFGTLGAVFSIDADKFFGLTAQHVTGKLRDIDQLGADDESRKLGDTTDPINPAPADFLNESVDASYITIANEATIEKPPEGVWVRGVSHGVQESPSSRAEKINVYFSKRRISRRDGNDLELLKFGNGSGILTKGEIDVRSKKTIINRKEFINNFTIKPLPPSDIFATPGDSGAFVAVKAKKINGDDEEAMVLVGVLFAGLTDSSRGLACSMPAVIESLELETKIPAKYMVDEWEA